jgi:hypothetical protein
LGQAGPIRNKYTYASDTNAVATASSVNSFYGSAAGNSTRGIFAIGCSCSVSTTTRNKYTYACDTNGTATGSSATSAYGSAASNGITGVSS